MQHASCRLPAATTFVPPAHMHMKPDVRSHGAMRRRRPARGERKCNLSVQRIAVGRRRRLGDYLKRGLAWIPVVVREDGMDMGDWASRARESSRR